LQQQVNAQNNPQKIRRQSMKKKPIEHRHPEHPEHPEHPGHEVQGRFPTLEELRREEAKMGIVRRFNPGEISEKIERHFAEILRGSGFPELEDMTSPSVVRSIGLKDVIKKPPSWTETQVAELFRREMLAILTAIDRPRVDHRTLDDNERKRFNEALQEVYADGSYSTLAAVHEDMSHRMHTIMGGGYIGGQRFLPWHRIYLVKMENLLRSKRWGVTIPYWNYSVDRARPDWVWQPPTVTRNAPGNGATLPSQATVDNLIYDMGRFTVGRSYDDFTNGVEFDAHNDVHNWCNGTITAPMTATRDPIFWLLHANVDRIWDLWQASHFRGPNLSGIDATMDPWPQTATDANRIISLGYMYQ
jgi:hypothetical protein